MEQGSARLCVLFSAWLGLLHERVVIHRGGLRVSCFNQVWYFTAVWLGSVAELRCEVHPSVPGQAPSAVDLDSSFCTVADSLQPTVVFETG